MKKVFAVLLCLALLCCTACTAQVPTTTDPTETTEATEATTEPTLPGAEIFTEELKAKLDAVLEEKKYDGIVSLSCNGETVYQWVRGNNTLGQPLTIDSPMFIGTISKHFCAAAILTLRDQGKLSLDDTLDKYFPEYPHGKDITLQHLLSMRSGIVRDMGPMGLTPDLFTDNTPEENEAAFKSWVFEQPLQFAPGTDFSYSNVNYTLLSFVVDMVSGENYHDFVRKTFLEPLGMNSTIFLHEVLEKPQCLLDSTMIKEADKVAPLITRGCGEIVTTAGDLDIWMTALQDGKVVCQESFREMTTDYAASYGYGLMRGLRGGWGHGGNIGTYGSQMYFNEEYGFNLFLVTNQATAYRQDITDKTFTVFLRTLFEAVDAASK